VNLATLRQRQSLDLCSKIRMSKNRIRSWYDHFDGEVYVAFSGGKDSTVLLHLARSMYPDIPAVFSDTGLEYPEIRNFVKTMDCVTWLKPKHTFKYVIENIGYPVGSKKTAKQIAYLQNPSPRNLASRNLAMTGVRACDGGFNKNSMLAKKWHKLITSKFKISEKCCDVLKKEPFRRYSKQTNRMAMTGTMAAEGGSRVNIKSCNAYTSKNPISAPLLFWTESDIWEYIQRFEVKHSKIYNQGETRTGCMFCAFGVQLEKGPMGNRFQRMATTHPKQWDYCINKLKMGDLLDFIGIPYSSNKVGR